MITTSHYINLSCALRYYKARGVSTLETYKLLDEGVISVGKPDELPGMILTISSDGYTWEYAPVRRWIA